MNLKPLTEKTKICIRCNKKKIFSAFHKDANRLDGKRGRCATCTNELKNERTLEKGKKEGRDYHLYRGGNTCVRCRVKHRKVAHPFKVGQYYSEYYVDGKWIWERPKCITPEK